MKKQSKMRARMLIGLAVLLISALLVGACAKAPAPTPAPGKPAATPTPAPAPAKPIKLVGAFGSAKTPGVHPGTDKTIWWLDELVKRSGGRIEIVEYWGGALGSTMAEMLELVKSGSVDISSGCPTCGTESFFPYEVLFNNIFLNFKTHEEVIRIMRILYDELPVLQESWAKQNALLLHQNGSGPHGFITKTPYKTLAELKGKKMISFGSYQPKMLNAIGVVPVTINLAESYDAIRSGLVDGRYVPLSNVISMKIYEVAIYLLKADTGVVSASPLFMNLKAYNSLPADLRKIIDDVTRETDDYYIRNFRVLNKGQEDFLSTRLTSIMVSPEEMQAWKKAMPPMQDEWVRDMEKLGQGAMARKVLDRVNELAAPGWKIATSGWVPEGVPAWAQISPVTGKDIRQ